MTDDIEQIKALKQSYLRYVDGKNWDGLRDILAPDVRVDLTAAQGDRYESSEAFVAFLAPRMDPVQSEHRGTDPQISLTSDTTASGVWAMTDWIKAPDGSTFGGSGQYHETYVKTDERWRISSLRLTRRND